MALNFQMALTFSFNQNHPSFENDTKTNFTDKLVDRRSFGTIEKAIAKAGNIIETHSWVNVFHVDVIDKTTKEVVWSWDASDQ